MIRDRLNYDEGKINAIPDPVLRRNFTSRDHAMAKKERRCNRGTKRSLLHASSRSRSSGTRKDGEIGRDPGELVDIWPCTPPATRPDCTCVQQPLPKQTEGVHPSVGIFGRRTAAPPQTFGLVSPITQSRDHVFVRRNNLKERAYTSTFPNPFELRSPFRNIFQQDNCEILSLTLNREERAI